jgi:hypothetical protein
MAADMLFCLFAFEISGRCELKLISSLAWFQMFGLILLLLRKPCLYEFENHEILMSLLWSQISCIVPNVEPWTYEYTAHPCSIAPIKLSRSPWIWRKGYIFLESRMLSNVSSRQGSLGTRTRLVLCTNLERQQDLS